MKKDVIYIDIEDDITSIIEKVKVAEAKIVALVPPKRTGVLQSVVNLKLLQKAADSGGKRVVLITNDHSLTALAAGLKMPVAKNLQSKPEVAEITALAVDDDEIINGADLPVGELAKTADPIPGAPTPPVKTPEPVIPNMAAAASAATLSSPPAARPKNKGKIPNFERFRKKLFLLGGLSVLLIIFLVWAIFFAPHATVTITAKTSEVNINKDLSLDPKLESSNPGSAKFKPLVQQIKKSDSAEFDTTGKKDVGTKAKGQLKVTNQTLEELTVPAGTEFIASGKRFRSDTLITLAAPYVCGDFNACKDTKTVDITAVAIGENYNVGPQEYEASAPVTASSDEATSGGSKETVAVVSQSDVDKAKAQIAAADEDSALEELKKQFTGDIIMINESFGASQAEPAASPAIGEQAKRAKVSVETTYTILALKRSEVKQMLDKTLKDELKGRQDQQIYASGDHSLAFSQFKVSPGGTYTVKLNTDGSIGPSINAESLASQLRSKRFGEIEQIVKSIDGVEDVSVKFSPFWVTSAPGNAEKIDIEFKITNGTE